MATHSSVLAWETPWTEEPSRPESMGSQKSRTQISDDNMAKIILQKSSKIINK